jgi:hypothetical protein
VPTHTARIQQRKTPAGAPAVLNVPSFHEDLQKEHGCIRRFERGSGALLLSLVPTYRSIMMPNSERITPNSERGGSSEQHAKAGEQSHKKTRSVSE